MGRPKSATIAGGGVESFLAHYGVKGMRWGVRRDDPGPVAVEVGAPAGKKVQTRGGERQPASEDAIRTAVLKRTALRSTTDSLSNRDLQDLVNRLNLEQQYDRLRPRKPSEQVAKFLRETLLNIGKDEASKYARGQINEIIKK